jgi:hypothetical protein
MQYSSVIFLARYKENPVCQTFYWNCLNLPPMVVGQPISFANELVSATDHLQSYSQHNECHYLALNQHSTLLLL